MLHAQAMHFLFYKWRVEAAKAPLHRPPNFEGILDTVITMINEVLSDIRNVRSCHDLQEALEARVRLQTPSSHSVPQQ